MNAIYRLCQWCVLLSMAAPATQPQPPAQPPAQPLTWILRRADFRTERAGLRLIDDSGLTLSGADGKSITVRFEDFLQLDRESAARGAAGPFIAELTDGDRHSGAPMSTDGETILWKSRSLGDVKLSMRDLSAIVRPNADAARLKRDEPRSEDVIILSNGDTVTGVIISVGKAGVAIQSSAGETNVPLDSLSAILFAAAPGALVGRPTSSASPRFRFTLSDQTTMTTAKPVLANNVFKLGATEIPLDSVISIEQLDGPVAWLSSRAPVENVQTPYLDTRWPARMNAAVTGEPLRAGGKTFARGIGVHSYSRLSWAIDSSFRTFRTQFAIDGDQPYANVVARIKLDGKVAFEQSEVVAGAIYPVVLVDLRGARTITLEVDYGENADVQDRFNWIEPALLRYEVKPAPTSQPTTSPATRPSTQPSD